MKKNEKEIQEAREHLLEMLKPGDTVETVLRHCSRSGMSRSISPVIHRDGQTVDLSYWIIRLLELSFDRKHDGVKMGGCGMDMGFALVYDMSRSLFPNGFECIGEKCPSNDHSNGDRNYIPHHHKDGGYALKQRWI